MCKLASSFVYATQVRKHTDTHTYHTHTKNRGILYRLVPAIRTIYHSYHLAIVDNGGQQVHLQWAWSLMAMQELGSDCSMRKNKLYLHVCVCVSITGTVSFPCSPIWSATLQLRTGLRCRQLHLWTGLHSGLKVSGLTGLKAQEALWSP